ncbi:MAG: methylated-DNA--[protein]-cysteine S-methyltransferase [Acidobacteriaceae bacterium]|nr:methylated-DNA--[protein]-cysteine S-methyltransferase [Acidobacteriaceae bacterium]
MRLYVAEQNGQIWSACLHDDQHPRTEDEFAWRLGGTAPWQHRTGHSPGALSASVQQIAEYFAGKRLAFTLPLSLRGTAFQVRVWQELQNIPYGAQQSYGEIAERIGKPNAFRAVGNANGRNNLPVFVPCHRVIAAGGKLGGYTGGIGLKKRLLAHEAAVLGQHAAA